MIRIFASISLTLLVALYFGASEMKYDTREARKEVQQIDRAIENEKQAIKILSAEWSHLTRPGNLRQLAEAHLGLDDVRAEQIAAIEDVPYLGFNLFEENTRGIPIRFDAVPRQKPPVTVIAQLAPQVAASHYRTIGQIEMASFEGFGD